VLGLEDFMGKQTLILAPQRATTPVSVLAQESVPVHVSQRDHPR
jgi:hypothetical protein